MRGVKEGTLRRDDGWWNGRRVENVRREGVQRRRRREKRGGKGCAG